MMILAALALGSSLTTVAAHRVPRLDVTPSCKAAATSGLSMGTGRTTQSCLNDEKVARQQLVKSWSTFAAASKSHCLNLITTGGPPSYVELLSCLEMSREAKNIANSEPSTGTISRKAPARSVQR